MENKITLWILLTALALYLPWSADAQSLANRLAGKILIQAENQGQAWYVNPDDFHRYYLEPSQAGLDVVRELKLTLSDNDFNSLNQPAQPNLAGKFFDSQDKDGQIYYLSPDDLILRQFEQISGLTDLISSGGLGISDHDLSLIPLADNGPQRLTIARPKPAGNHLNYLGWWGQINTDEAPVMDQPSTAARLLGKFSAINKVKILETVEGEAVNGHNRWYKIDGGAHPGAFVFSDYISAIDQPEPPRHIILPQPVKANEYWIDVDLTKKVLTLFLYDQPIFATYVAIGRPANPTLPGSYRIWSKLASARMSGGPPVVPYYYNLADVPWVMYYHGSYAIHGTYWHDEFGTQKSAGCTNLTQGDASFIFNLVNPPSDQAVNYVRSSAANPGTLVYNHY